MRWKLTPEERFWSKVDPCRTDGCMVWVSTMYINGYGMFSIKKKRLRAHHFLIGKAPVGLEWDHLCRNRACICPDHLEAVTRSVNMKRGDLGRVLRERALKITHCPQGHEYTPANTLYFPSRGNRRKCRICRDAYWKKYQPLRRKSSSPLQGKQA